MNWIARNPRAWRMGSASSNTLGKPSSKVRQKPDSPASMVAIAAS